MERREIGVLPEWQLFEQKVDGEHNVVGFNAPDGTYYPLGEGEELVHNKTQDGKNRETFIRKGGQDTPFETWKEDK